MPSTAKSLSPSPWATASVRLSRTALATGISLARRFVSALASESSRWNDEADRVGSLFRYVLGDAMFAAALLTLLSPFPLTARERILSVWSE